ncbi:27617_t:CDS:1, partial [Racocetra persica]
LLARIKSGRKIQVQVESIKRRKLNMKRVHSESNENDIQNIPKRKARMMSKKEHNLQKNVLNNSLN